MKNTKESRKEKRAALNKEEERRFQQRLKNLPQYMILSKCEKYIIIIQSCETDWANISVREAKLRDGRSLIRHIDLPSLRLAENLPTYFSELSEAEYERVVAANGKAIIERAIYLHENYQPASN